MTLYLNQYLNTNNNNIRIIYVVVVIAVLFLLYKNIGYKWSLDSYTCKQLYATMYKQDNFPLQLAICNTHARIKNDAYILASAAKAFNTCTGFEFFDISIVDIVRVDDIGRDDKTLYVFTGCYQHLPNHEPFDGPGHVMAHATLPPHKQLCIDSSETWSPQKLYSTVLHELGHILGLLHSSDPASLMYKFYRPANTLHSSDIETLQLAYPFIKK